VLRDAVRERFGVTLAAARGDARPETASRLNAIALGCLADNPLIEREYFRFRTLVDRWHPGPGGRVLQSIHPAGDDSPNILVVGGSDAAGVLAAARELAALIADLTGPDLGWLLRVKLGAEHLPLPRDRIDALGSSVSPVPTPEGDPPAEPYRPGYPGGPIHAHLLRLGMYGPNADNSHFCRSSQFALRYLYSGRAEDGARYRDAFLAEVRQGVIRELYHYKSVRMFQLWELLAPSPVFCDDERRQVNDAVRDYLLHGTGVAALARIEAKSVESELFDRHLACDALNLRIGADYFLRHTGDPQWRAYRDIADRYFRAQAGVDVPYTGLTEGYFSYLEVYLDWMLQTCPERIAGDPDVRQWAERCLGLCTNQGLMVVGAQSEEARYGYGLLRKLARLLDDGRFLFAANLRERAVQRGNDRLSQFSAGQAYAGDVKPEPPGDMAGLTVFPMNERLRLWKARDLPRGAGFDRAVGRSGWAPDDEYFVIAGVRGGAKVLPNVGAVAAYERFGVQLLASPVMALHAPENSPLGYSVVTVTQAGLGPGLHSAARLLAQRRSAGLEILVFRMTAPDLYDWDRTVAWKPGGFLLVADRVRMHQPGAFSVAAHWRCANPMTVDGAAAWCDCVSPEGVSSRFFVATTAPDLQYEDRPQCQVDETPDETSPRLPVLHAIVDGRGPEEGEVAILTLLHAVPGAGPPEYVLQAGPDGAVVSGAEECYACSGLADPAEATAVREPAGAAPVPRQNPRPATVTGQAAAASLICRKK